MHTATNVNCVVPYNCILNNIHSVYQVTNSIQDCRVIQSLKPKQVINVISAGVCVKVFSL